MAISVDWPTGVITVPKADLTLIQSTPSEVRELNIDTFRLSLDALQADIDGQVWATTHIHYAGITVGGVTLAEVVELINGYTVTFENGTYAVNLVGANSNIADVTNLNSVSVRSSNSAGLIQEIDIAAIKYQIESLRESHQGYGNTFYYDPVNGNDVSPGTDPTTPVKTFATALSLCLSGRGDVIYILAPSAGQVTIDDRWVINKESVYIRGPGRGVLLQPSTSGGSTPTISIEANEVSLSGFIVEAATADAATANAIDVWGKFSEIDNMWIGAANNGIRYCAGDAHTLVNTEVEDQTAVGVLIEDVRYGTAFEANGPPQEIDISGNSKIYDNQTGIKLVADTTNYTAGQSTRRLRLYNTDVMFNSGYGIDVGAGVYDVALGAEASIHDNTSGNLLDNGTGTANRSVEAVVWDEPTANHTTVGSTGEALTNAGAAGNPWSVTVSGNTNSGTFGELVGDKLLTVAKFLGLK